MLCYWRGGRRILFEPSACLHHLKVATGGTRTYGEHLTTWRPDHAVGAYYFGLRTGAWREFAARPLRAVATRYHLARPWRIPATLVAELGGEILDGPGEFPFGPGGYYAFYFRGPDRLKFEVVHMPVLENAP